MRGRRYGMRGEGEVGDTAAPVMTRIASAPLAAGLCLLCMLGAVSLAGPALCDWALQHDLVAEPLDERWGRLFSALGLSLVGGVLAALLAVSTGVALTLAVAPMPKAVSSALAAVLRRTATIPSFVTVLVIVAIAGQEFAVACLALGAAHGPATASRVLEEFLRLRDELWLLAARSAGVTGLDIWIREIAQNAVPFILRLAATLAGVTTIELAGLGLLTLAGSGSTAELGALLGTTLRTDAVFSATGAAPALLLLAVAGLWAVVAASVDPDSAKRESRRGCGPTPAASYAERVRQARPHDRRRSLLSFRDLGVATQGSTGHGLEGITFDVAPGEAVAILGGNRDGGRLLLQSVVRVVPDPTALIVRGQILLRGLDLASAPFQQLQVIRGGAIGYLPRNPYAVFLPGLTIGRQMADRIRRGDAMSDKAAAGKLHGLLAEAGFDDPAKTACCLPAQIPVEACRRAALALVAAAAPELILVDDPTAGLDVLEQEAFLTLLERCCGTRGAALLATTESPGVAARLGSRVAVLHAGRLVEIGPARAVLTAPRHPFTSAFLGAVPVAGAQEPAMVRVPPMTTPSVKAHPEACRYAGRCGHETERCQRNPVTIGYVGADHGVRCLHARERAA